MRQREGDREIQKEARNKGSVTARGRGRQEDTEMEKKKAWLTQQKRRSRRAETGKSYRGRRPFTHVSPSAI